MMVLSITCQLGKMNKLEICCTTSVVNNVHLKVKGINLFVSSS